MDKAGDIYTAQPVDKRAAMSQSRGGVRGVFLLTASSRVEAPPKNGIKRDKMPENFIKIQKGLYAYGTHDAGATILHLF